MTNFMNYWNEFKTLPKYQQSTNLIQIVSCFRAILMFIHFVQVYCWIFRGSSSQGQSHNTRAQQCLCYSALQSRC